MKVYSNQLPELIDIIDTIIPIEKSNFTQEEEYELIESTLYLLDEYILQNIRIFEEPHYKAKIIQYIYETIEEIIENTYKSEDEYLENDYMYEDIIALLCEKVFQCYFSSFMHRRSYKKNYILHTIKKEEQQTIKQKIDIIRKKDAENDGQRTDKWYETRYNLLSASSIWKVLGSESSKNAIIFEKCEPCKYSSGKQLNLNSPLHWGQIYEPLAQTYYELTYDAKIEEFGCIQHSKYNFIGASPDGINVKMDSHRYGRMLEIKSVVSREINGIPKKEYWIQTQIQMECCDLDECDFLECKFEEYKSYDEFLNDTYIENINNTHIFNRTHDNKTYKGVILCFMNVTKEEPIYEYCPMTMTNIEDFEKWEKTIMGKYTNNNVDNNNVDNNNVDNNNQNDTIVWVQTRYWKLDKVSCVLICRNKDWFESVLPIFKEVWDTILKERVHGYEHRKPRTKKSHLLNDNIILTSDNKSNIKTINVIKQDYKEVEKVEKVEKDDVKQVKSLFDLDICFEYNNEPCNTNDKKETTTITQPETITTQPETITTQPETITTQPETITTQPETITTQPETITTQPETITTQPETNNTT
jgi:putative phage-type endonuclease